MATRKQSDLSLSRLRSAITNGTAVLSGVDHRSPFMRRLKDLRDAHLQDAGGEDILSEGQRALIARASMLELQLEMLDSKFASNDGAASAQELDLYGRTAGALRRVLEALDLHRGRKQRDVTPTLQQYLRQTYPEPAE
jgi:hypothetical protein